MLLVTLSTTLLFMGLTCILVAALLSSQISLTDNITSNYNTLANSEAVHFGTSSKASQPCRGKREENFSLNLSLGHHFSIIYLSKKVAK